MTGLLMDDISMRFELPNGGHIQALQNVTLDIKTGELMSFLVHRAAAKPRFSTSSPVSWPPPRAGSC